MIQIIGPFLNKLTEMNTLKIWLAEQDPFWKIWLIEIEPFFSTWVKENDSIFDHDSKNISFYIFDSKNNDPFWEIMTQRIELFFLKKHNDSKNWTFFKKSKNWSCWSFFTNKTHSKNSSLLNLFIWLKELNTFSWIWLKELDLFQNDSKNWTVSQNDSKNLTSFSQNDSKNWTFSSKWLQIFVLWIWLRIDFLIMILRMVLFCLLWLINWTFFLIRPKGLNFFIDWYDPKDCFFSYESQNRTLFWTRKNWTFFFHDTKNWTFLKIIWLQDLKLLWIGRWNFLNLDQGIEAFSTISLKNDWPFLDMTLRVEPFFNMTHRIEPF